MTLLVVVVVIICYWVLQVGRFRPFWWLCLSVQLLRGTPRIPRTFQVFRRSSILTWQYQLSCISHPVFSKVRNNVGSSNKTDTWIVRSHRAKDRYISRLKSAFEGGLFPFFCSGYIRWESGTIMKLRIPSSWDSYRWEDCSKPGERERKREKRLEIVRFFIFFTWIYSW